MEIDKLIHYGGALKALGDNRIGGYLVKFTDPNTRDLYGEYFDKDTEFMLENYPIKGAPALFHHGLDEAISVIPLGEIETVRILPDGIYAETTNNFAERYKAYLTGLKEPDEWKAQQLEYAKEYQTYINEMVAKGLLGWSSGAMPQGVIRAEDGYIKRWPIMEGSLTPAAAMPEVTKVFPLKSLAPFSLKEFHAKEATANEQVITQTNEQQDSKGLKTMDLEQLKQFIQDVLVPLMAAMRGEEMGDMGVDPEAAMQAVQDEATSQIPQDSEMVKSADKAAIEKKIHAIFQTVIAKSVTEAMQKRENAASLVKNAMLAGKNAFEPAGRAPVGGFDNGARKSSDPHISVSENLRYAGLSAEDMLLGYELFGPHTDAGRRDGNTPALRHFRTDEYWQHMVGKTEKSVENPYTNVKSRDKDVSYMKSVMRGVSAVKANEIDTTANTGFGPEWVGQVWSTRIWEKARVLRIYEQLMAKGMMEVEIPQGASTANISTEAADPTVYSYPQTADLSSGQPPAVLNATPFGTGTVALAPGALGLASVYSVILEEDSVIPILPQLNYQISQKMQETIEQVIVNGDVATGANTNINLIDGTPGTGTSRPYYLASDGLLKYPLVTAPALARTANGSLSLDDFRATLALFAPQFQTRLSNLIYVLDPYVSIAALAIPEIATDDVRRTNATIASGVISNLYGIDVVNEGFMLKANSSGKVPAAGGTLGRFLLVYAPYWAFGFKRNIKVETFYNPIEQARIVTGTMRFGLVNRGRDASAVTYNVGI
jgi:hypothetical protein